LANRLVAALLVLALAVVATRAWLRPSECPSAKLFGRSCVACGVTRDVGLLLRGERAVHNPCSVLYVVWLPLEVGFRVVGGGLRHPRLFAAVDVFVHVVLAVIWAVLIWPFVAGG
jgi:hypothetical protein